MADLTTASTFIPFVMGNKRGVYVDVTTGLSTLDTISVPLSRISFASISWNSTAGTSVAPSVGFSGTTVMVFMGAATTAAGSYRLKVEGH